MTPTAPASLVGGRAADLPPALNRGSMKLSRSRHRSGHSDLVDRGGGGSTRTPAQVEAELLGGAAALVIGVVFGAIVIPPVLDDLARDVAAPPAVIEEAFLEANDSGDLGPQGWNPGRGS